MLIQCIFWENAENFTASNDYSMKTAWVPLNKLISIKQLSSVGIHKTKN